MRFNLLFITLGSIWLLIQSCDSPANNAVEEKAPVSNTVTAVSDSPVTEEVSLRSRSAGPTFPYNLKEPDQKVKLPKDLEEISALSYVKKNELVAVQDEKGKIFRIDLKKEEIIDDIKFGPRGDYEGIELVGKDAWVLQSDGVLHRVEDWQKEDPVTEKIPTGLAARNDTEGLGMSADGKLLIACKASSKLGEKKYKGKAIYAFDLNTTQLDPTPFLLINFDELEKPSEDPVTRFSENLIKALDPDINFQPSGIARHPQTGHYYIIASAGQVLVVVDESNEVLFVEKLPKKVFKQPEGICFSPKGELFISNEGVGGKGNVLRFQAK
ncbi:MAG: hypothetical protein AAGI38_12490 [Bacteroidota bacterium]